MKTRVGIVSFFCFYDFRVLAWCDSARTDRLISPLRLLIEISSSFTRPGQDTKRIGNARLLPTLRTRNKLALQGAPEFA